MKLCKDCRWCSAPDTLLEVTGPGYFDKAVHLEMFGMVAECRHPTARREEPPDPVTGFIRSHWRAARNHREAAWRDDEPTCGPHGLYFEPKQPLEPVGFGEPDPDPKDGGAMAEPEA